MPVPSIRYWSDVSTGKCIQREKKPPHLSTTTIGDSELVTSPSPFQIMRPEAMTAAKFSTWSKTCENEVSNWAVVTKRISQTNMTKSKSFESLKLLRKHIDVVWLRRKGEGFLNGKDGHVYTRRNWRARSRGRSFEQYMITKSYSPFKYPRELEYFSLIMDWHVYSSNMGKCNESGHEGIRYKTTKTLQSISLVSLGLWRGGGHD